MFKTNDLNYQANAVRAYLGQFEGIVSSWDGSKYLAKPEIREWINGRERGYVISLKNPKDQQLNIAFFEHRNSDSIHAVQWEQRIDHPTINNAHFPDGVYQDKWQTSHAVEYGQAEEMAVWIYSAMAAFWNAS